MPSNRRTSPPLNRTTKVLHTFKRSGEPALRVLQMEDDLDKHYKLPPARSLEYVHHVDGMGQPAWQRVDWSKPLPSVVAGLCREALETLALMGGKPEPNPSPQDGAETDKPA